jgi:hypothetical protein
LASKIQKEVVQDNKISETKIVWTKGLVGTLNIPTYKQWYNKNTCVIDNISLVVKSITWKEINKTIAYEKIGKKLWEMWTTGLYYIGSHGEWVFEPVKANEYLYDDTAKKYVRKNLVQWIVETW